MGDEREIDHSRIRKHEPREYVLPRMDRISVISSVVPPVHRNLSVVRQHGRRGVHRLHQSLRGSQTPRSQRVDCNRVVRNFDPKLVVQTVLLVKPAGPELGGQCIVNMTFSPLPWAPVAEAREHLSALGALP